ncbi:MAG: UvrD-helicase domain-containing protein, partial [Bacteroidota bacterium]
GQFVKWSKDDFKEPGKKALAGLEEEAVWYTKKSPLKERIAAVANEHLMPLLSKGVHFYQEHLAAYFTASEVRKYLYTFGILNDLVTKIREYREEKEVILISDLPQFLRKIIDDSDTPYIYEKFGNRFHHFLIDEFQDTSHFQWNNFKPLVTNSLASGNFNMIVGDVKQSIYRWRGGNADLLLSEAAADVGEQMATEQVLSQNFRSHAEVIDFNNEIFQVAPLMLQAFLNDEIAHLSESNQLRAVERIERLVQSFESAVQEKTPKTQTGGHVQVSFSTKPKMGEELRWDDLAVAWAINQLETCQQHGVAMRDIAILVRDSGQESKLVKAIGLHEQSEEAVPGCSYQVVSAQAMYLTNASVVNFMLAVFKYLNNQKEQIALMEVVNEYQRHILGSDTDPHLLYTRDVKNFLPPEFTNYLHTLGRFPLYELTEILIRIFKLDRKKGELAYLQAFQDAILDCTRKEKGDLPSFLSWWELKGRKRTVRFSDSLDAARILTIHKSKGLQFHTVIMPFCNWKMDHNTLFSNILWKERPAVEPYDNLPAIPLRYSSGLRESLFADEYFEEKVKAHHDNLNLLYVAFTRAEQTLLVHSETPGKSRQPGSISSVSDLLWDHLKDSQYFDEEDSKWEVGNPVLGEEKAVKENISEVFLNHYPSYKWRNRLTIRKQSGNYFDFGESAQELKVNLGVLTHQILSEVQYSEELVPAVKAAYRKMEITKEDADQLLRGFEQLLTDDQMARWYSREYEVRNEVVVLPGDGSIKRLDRVMIKDNEAIVVDFKTGKPVSGDKQQVGNYVALLQEMAYEQVSGYLVYLTVGVSENEQIKPQVIQVV